MDTEQAKKQLKKYRISNLITSFAALVFYVLVALSGNGRLMIGALAFAILLIRGTRVLFFSQFITKPLYSDLDAPLYQAIVKEGKLYVPSAILQLQGEYYAGNYQNVISGCNQKLSDPKIAAKYKYNYLGFLANVYFDLGDIEKLTEVIAKFNQSVASESPKTAKRILKRMPRISFYTNYLNGDFDACLDFIGQPQTLKIVEVRSLYFSAHIALAKGETEQAKKLFERILQMAPKLNYAELSKHALESIENSLPYRDTFEMPDAADCFTVTEPPKSRKVWRIVRLVSGILMLACIIGYAVVSIWAESQKTRYENELAAHIENVRLLVEEDYDGVEVLDTFNLKKGEEVVDSMFLCKTEDSVLLGALYTYQDDDQIYYDIEYEMPLSDLDEEINPLMTVIFQCSTSDYYVYSAFYTNENDVPDDYCHLSSVKVGDRNLYFAVTEISNQPPF